MDGNVVRRVAFAAVAIPIALGIVYLGGLPLTGLVMVASVLGTRELFGLARQGGVEPLTGVGLLGAAALGPLTYLALTSPDVSAVLDAWWPMILGLTVVALLVLTLATRPPGNRPLGSVAVTVLGLGYTGALPAFLLAIRHGTGVSALGGTALVFFPLVVTWVTDTAAMFGGRAMKGPKLAPSVSPGKTWSGSIAGVVGALAVTPLWMVLALEPAGVAFPWWQALVMAAVLGVIGQIGDLVESLFKREAGVKDSSTLIPGHGGVLDRLDSLYFVIPVAALLYRLFGVA
jgi:phosphatidate cytidylyltransferase